MADAPHITNLPREVIQEIVRLCPIGDVLVLGRTCHYLHDFCYDVSILQQSILYNESYLSPTNRDSVRKLLAERSAAGNDTHTWICLAMATSELPSLINELDWLVGDLAESPHSWGPNRLNPVGQRRIRNIVGVLNTLTILGCSRVEDFTPREDMTIAVARLLELDLLHGSSGKHPHPGSARISLGAGMSLVLAVYALKGTVMDVMPRSLDVLDLRPTLRGVMETEGSAQVFGGSEGFFEGFVGRSSAFFERSNNGSHDGDFLWYDSFMGSQTIGLLIIIDLLQFIGSYPEVLARDDLPTAATLPLLNVRGSGGHIPLPDGDSSADSSLGGIRDIAEEGEGTGVLLSVPRSMDQFGLGQPWSSWLRNNVDVLIEDICHGEWVGYYTLSVGQPLPDEINGLGNVAPPLRNIHFETERDKKDTDKMIIGADQCIDGTGSFSLTGTLYRSAGLVHLVKRYPEHGTKEWHVKGTLTPLGIAGYWGKDLGTPFGWVWMYKKEWVPSSKGDHIPGT